MTRHRFEAPGALHHVVARGVNRQLIFIDDADYELYVRLLGLVVARYGWICLGFCLMPNHVHLLVETPEPNLGAGMQWLQSQHARRFNERHDRAGEGHVFQGPYGNRVVSTDLYLLRVAAYLAGNPVTGGLCDAPGDWPWSTEGFASRRLLLPWMKHDVLQARLQQITGREDFLSTLVL